MHWQLATRDVALDRPFLLGVVNATPDSFSDGGRHGSVAEVVAHAEALLDDGADAVDIGGESTRPHNGGGVPAEEEVARVLPVVRALRQRRAEAIISVDTTKAVVARAVLDAGADIVNDVSAFRLDREMATVCADARAGVILMHSRGEVGDMATFAHAAYRSDAVGEIVDELANALEWARVAGLGAAQIVLDPGVGFAKRSATSLAVLDELPRLVALGRPVLVGASRKRFVGELSGVSDPAARVHGSIGAHVLALARGARLFRVHDVRAHREALDVAWGILERRA